MIYIYDILVNFNNKLYDFYDWKENDYLEHIRKIPIIKVKEKVLLDIINNKIKIKKELLNLIYNKTEVFSDIGIEKISYSLLVGTSTSVIALIFDKEGKLREYSSLLIDEEVEILEIIKTLKCYNFEYEIIEKITKVNLLREEESKIQNIIKELKNIKDNNKEELLKYLYYEWFYKEPKTNNYFNKLIKDIEKKYSNKHDKFLELLNFVKNT